MYNLQPVKLICKTDGEFKFQIIVSFQQLKRDYELTGAWKTGDSPGFYEMSHL